MKIIVTPVVSRIVDTKGLTPEIIDEIDSECSFYCEGSFFTPQFQYALWDGMRRLFSKRTLSFGTGLLNRILSITNKYNAPVEIEKKYPPIKNIDVGSLKLTLYDYQKEALSCMLEHERGVVKLPTGAGKGCLISAIICERKVPTIILVHRRDLLYQTVERLKKEADIEAGVVGDGSVKFKDVTVAMIQTLLRSLGMRDKEMERDNTVVENVKEKIAYYNMLISDEVHVLGTSLCMKLLKLFKNAVYRYGFSATPFYRDEALVVESIVGPIIYEKKVPELDLQYIATAKIVFVPFVHEKRERKWLKYREVYDQEVVYNEQRNLLIKKLAERYKDHRVLIAVRKVEHGKILNNMIKGSKFVYGSSETEERREILEIFRKGITNCVIATVIWEQGIDIPEATVLIDTRAEKSRLAFIQLIGRVLRRTPTKDKALVLDIYDCNCKWISQHARERVKIAIEEFGLERVFKLKGGLR
jgi:superfamily II DNA or RNA helicase